MTGGPWKAGIVVPGDVVPPVVPLGNPPLFDGCAESVPPRATGAFSPRPDDELAVLAAPPQAAAATTMATTTRTFFMCERPPGRLFA